MKETSNSKEIMEVLDNAIEDYKKVYADCTPQDIQMALVKLLEEHL